MGGNTSLETDVSPRASKARLWVHTLGEFFRHGATCGGVFGMARVVHRHQKDFVLHDGR